MRVTCLAICVLAVAPAVCAPPPVPKLLSLHPFTGYKGGTFVVLARGSGLAGATAAYPERADLKFRIQNIEQQPAPDGKSTVDIVKIEVEAGPQLASGRYPLRVVTAGGVSNGLSLNILDSSPASEPDGPHDTPETAIAIERVPAIYTGMIRQKGEVDYYSFSVQAGQTITFEVLSGLPAPGAPGGNARGFDPSISIWEPSGSWFDSGRLNRVAFNDEPLWVTGEPTDAHLVHKFAKAGRYFVRVEAFSGQGGPDYSYQLKVLPGRVPPDLAPKSPGWTEREFSRRLSANRLNELAERGGKPQDQPSIETYRAAPISGPPAPFKLPGTLEGVIDQPGAAFHARFHLDGPRDIAIEVETPGVAPPLFNPVVRLLNAAGEEVATTILAGKGACTGALTKSLQAKAIVPLRDPGDYTVEIRDLTADLADPGFRYRVQVRPQLPHIGQVRIEADIVNVTAGEARTVRVMFDREEDFRGAVAVSAENLPPGVQALTGADYEPDKDPPAYTGKRERYVPRTERAVLVFSAAPDAASTSRPISAKVVVRPIADGKPGAPLAVKEIPIMVVKP